MTTAIETNRPQHDRCAETQGTLQLVSFRLGKEEFGVEITQVREIILMGDITRIPQTPAYVKGLINLRSTEWHLNFPNGLAHLGLCRGGGVSAIAGSA